MAALDEVNRMQQEGLSEEQIINNLREKGFPYKDISEALSQSQIKAAVEEPYQDLEPQFFQLPQQPQNQQNIGEDLISLPQIQETTNPLIPEQNPPLPLPENIQVPLPIPDQNPRAESYSQYPEYQNYAEPYQPPQQTQDYPPPGIYENYANEDTGYDYGGSGISSDTIAEISEQIVSEKLLEIRKHLEKVIDFKTILEAKTDSIDERLRRIEKTIATLQSSVLRKVGDYVTNIDDIKKELIETQKSFSKLISAKKTLSSTPEKVRKKSAKKS